MTQKFKQIKIENLDQRFKTMEFGSNPKDGWLKTIRSALNMPLHFLAKKLGVTPQSISQLEQSEKIEAITLRSLRQLAEVMDCELHYAIIPREKSLKKIIERRASQKATALVKEVDKTMALEDQKIDNIEKSIQLLSKDFTENLNTKLWEDERN